MRFDISAMAILIYSPPTATGSQRRRYRHVTGGFTKDGPHPPADLGAAPAKGQSSSFSLLRRPRAARNGHERYPADSHDHGDRTSRGGHPPPCTTVGSPQAMASDGKWRTLPATWTPGSAPMITVCAQPYNLVLRPTGVERTMLTELLRDQLGRGRLRETVETAAASALRSARPARTCETLETHVILLITQRSRVQIPPPLPRPEALSRTEKGPSACGCARSCAQR